MVACMYIYIYIYIYLFIYLYVFIFIFVFIFLFIFLYVCICMYIYIYILYIFFFVSMDPSIQKHPLAQSARQGTVFPKGRRGPSSPEDLDLKRLRDLGFRGLGF